MAFGPLRLSLLSSPTPTATTATPLSIEHLQLRDLIVCPRDKGTVAYINQSTLSEATLSDSKPSSTRTLARLSFAPNTIAALPVEDTTLYAAGGQHGELHLSLHAPTSFNHGAFKRRSCLWELERSVHGSINNSVLLTGVEGCVEPHLFVSTNDFFVQAFRVPVRSNAHPTSGAMMEIGSLRLEFPVNHSSLAPDGRTLLSVGDSPKVHLHRMSGTSKIDFTPIAQLCLPPQPGRHASSATASFSSSWSSDGSKFAVASQEGGVVVWDVRSTKPLKVFHTDKTRGNLLGEPFDWTTSGAPSWAVRTVKFGRGGCGNNTGKEMMVFSEHQSVLHVVDARTFETEEIVRVPNLAADVSRARSMSPTRPLRKLSTPETIRERAETLRQASPVVSPYRHLTPTERRRREQSFAVVSEPQQEMDVDEAEPDCVSSRAPSRSSSPSPSNHLPSQASPPPPPRASPAGFVPSERPQPRRHHRDRTPTRESVAAERENIDIAGVCFDPSGAYVYAATLHGISQWKIRGSEKRWSSSSGWL